MAVDQKQLAEKLFFEIYGESSQKFRDMMIPDIQSWLEIKDTSHDVLDLAQEWLDDNVEPDEQEDKDYE